MLKLSFSKLGLSELSGELLIIPASKEDIAALQRGKKAKRPSRAAVGLTLRVLDQMLPGKLLPFIKRRRFEGAIGETLHLSSLTLDRFQEVLLVGWNPKIDDTVEKLIYYRKLGATVYENAERLRVSSISLAATNLELADDGPASAFFEGLFLNGYKFNRYKSAQVKEYSGINEIVVLGGKRIADRVLKDTLVACDATMLARDLVNMPPCDCTPSFLMRKAKEIAKKGKLQLQILDRERLAKLGANALLAVSQGSSEPPYLMKLTYKPKGRSARVLSLVGKGITFDSGGLSIKTAAGMETMKCDMSGAAAVLATMQAIAVLKPKFEVRAYVPTCENMINGKATRPGDVVKAMNGKTIEILNTDAEGRLILADAISLAVKEKCNHVIDLATLTGACVVALGPEYAGLFSNDNKLADKLVQCGELSGEAFWRMPLAPEYREFIKSPVADIKNTGGPWGGAITAALFLNEFVGDNSWAHLDIAGPAFSDSNKGHIKRGGVGFGVRTLLRYVLGK